MFVESVAVNDKGKLDHYSRIIRPLLGHYSRPLFESESTTELKNSDISKANLCLFAVSIYTFG